MYYIFHVVARLALDGKTRTRSTPVMACRCRVHCAGWVVHDFSLVCLRLMLRFDDPGDTVSSSIHHIPDNGMHRREMYDVLCRLLRVLRYTRDSILHAAHFFTT